MGAKILVVDDEQDFIEFVSFNLRRHGYEVLTAGNGLDALFQARQALPDLIVLDLMMEGIDGYSVCEILRRQPSTRTMPIIMLTAAGGEMARLNGLASGADDFINKPVPPRELIRRIEDVLLSCQKKMQEEVEADSDGSR